MSTTKCSPEDIPAHKPKTELSAQPSSSSSHIDSLDVSERLRRTRKVKLKKRTKKPGLQRVAAFWSTLSPLPMSPVSSPVSMSLTVSTVSTASPVLCPLSTSASSSAEQPASQAVTSTSIPWKLQPISPWSTKPSIYELQTASAPWPKLQPISLTKKPSVSRLKPQSSTITNTQPTQASSRSTKYSIPERKIHLVSRLSTASVSWPKLQPISLSKSESTPSTKLDCTGVTRRLMF